MTLPSSMHDPNRPSNGNALLLFDGTCGFCAQSVQFVLRHEKRQRTLRFASLQSQTGQEVRTQHPELDNVDSVIWVEQTDAGETSQLFVRSAAVLRVLGYLGGIWRVLAVLGALVPRFLRDALYDFIARHRQKLIRGGASCLLPTPEQRARFIEWETISTT